MARVKTSGTTKSVKKIVKKTLTDILFYIKASYGNTIITATDPYGNVLAFASAGGCGYRGARKSTPHAAAHAAEVLLEKLMNVVSGAKEASIFVNGPGPGRESAARTIGSKLKVKLISDVTGLPHNGCRKKKKRKV